MGQLEHFWMESKAFKLSPKEWRSSTKVVEKNKRVWRIIVMGRVGIRWLVAMLEANRAFMAKQCSNVHGRYLTVTKYGGGGWQSDVIIPDGYEGLGREKFCCQVRQSRCSIFLHS